MKEMLYAVRCLKSNHNCLDFPARAKIISSFDIERSVREGELDPYLANLLSELLV